MSFKSVGTIELPVDRQTFSAVPSGWSHVWLAENSGIQKYTGCNADNITSFEMLAIQVFKYTCSYSPPKADLEKHSPQVSSLPEVTTNHRNVYRDVNEH